MQVSTDHTNRDVLINKGTHKNTYPDTPRAFLQRKPRATDIHRDTNIHLQHTHTDTKIIGAITNWNTDIQRHKYGWYTLAIPLSHMRPGIRRQMSTDRHKPSRTIRDRGITGILRDTPPGTHPGAARTTSGAHPFLRAHSGAPGDTPIGGR